MDDLDGSSEGGMMGKNQAEEWISGEERGGHALERWYEKAEMRLATYSHAHLGNDLKL